MFRFPHERVGVQTLQWVFEWDIHNRIALLLMVMGGHTVR